MSLFSKATSLVSQATGAIQKAANSQVGKALSNLPGVGLAINAVGAVAQAASAVTAIKESKGQTPSATTQMAPSLSTQKTKVEGSATMWDKAKAWFMTNKKNIIIVLVGGIVGWLVYTFIFAKKGTRRKSPRRVSQAARMRAAKAAKRRK